MAGMCCGIKANETGPETASPVQPAARSARRRRMEIRKMISDISETHSHSMIKRRKSSTSASESSESTQALAASVAVEEASSEGVDGVEDEFPKFGVTSVCGRRRDMEDAVSILPFFRRADSKTSKKRKFNHEAHFYGVFDGHGCSHVAKKCKERMHAIVQEEMERIEGDDGDGEVVENWSETMSFSFNRMDREVGERADNNNDDDDATTSSCRCELQTPQCDAVGSTAVVAVVTPDKIVVSNCGDSRAVLCRGGVAVALSSDHKPDRPDELDRIEQAGGRVIYWDGARVLGMLAMSRAIGDNYLKPYVIPDPEVTITDRTPADECLIIASDGLWDVVSNETAASVARMCLINAAKPPPPSPPQSPGNDAVVDAGRESSDKACSDASILLTKLALARHSADNVSVVVVDLRRSIR